MKEKTLIYTVDTDITGIECDLADAEIIISEAEDGKFSVEYPNANNICIANGESGLIVNQRKRRLLFNGRQEIKINVPAHTVPAIKICGKNCRTWVLNGLYGEFLFSADNGNVTLRDCSFDSVEILGGDVNAQLFGATVKGTMFLQLDRGNLLTENTFATRSECRLKRGNIGLANVSCKDCAFDTKKGNISVTLSAAEENFNTTLVTREGISNRDSAKREGADGNFQAFTGKGNITLDFLEKSSPAIPLFEAVNEAAATDAEEEKELV